MLTDLLCMLQTVHILMVSRCSYASYRFGHYFKRVPEISYHCQTTKPLLRSWDVELRLELIEIERYSDIVVKMQNMNLIFVPG